MHKVLMTHPLIRLAANLALFAVLVPLRDKLIAVEVIAHVLDDDARLCEHHRRRGVLVFERDDGGFPQRVDFFQGGRRKHVCLALVGLEIIGEVELFKEPDDALGAGLV